MDIDGGLHLGNNLSNQTNIMGQDIKIKRAQFINKNNELNQKFWFSHPSTKFTINQIYNFHFTGSPIWDLFCKEAVVLEHSWNTAVRLMYNLPLQAHRYFIEPMSEVNHLKFILIERFLGFIDQIHKPGKTIPKHILKYKEHDVRSVTGSNLRNILLLTDKHTVEEIDKHDVRKPKYNEVAVENAWKIGVVKEIFDIMNNQLSLTDFSMEELSDIFENLCIS